MFNKSNAWMFHKCIINIIKELMSTFSNKLFHYADPLPPQCLTNNFGNKKH